MTDVPEPRPESGTYEVELVINGERRTIRPIMSDEWGRLPEALAERLAEFCTDPRR